MKGQSMKHEHIGTRKSTSYFWHFTVLCLASAGLLSVWYLVGAAADKADAPPKRSGPSLGPPVKPSAAVGALRTIPDSQVDPAETAELNTIFAVSQAAMASIQPSPDLGF